MKNKILIIDGQIFQTAARDRGMGRYSEFFVRSIVEQGHYDKIKLIVSDKYYSSNSLHKYFNSKFRNVEIVFLDLFDTSDAPIEQAQVLNKGAINRYLSKNTINDNLVDFLILSPFQEPAVSVFPDGVKRLLVFYDLIPYLYHERYKHSMNYKDYLKRFSLIFESDVILSISQSVRDDLMVYLGIPGSKIFSIDGAAIKSVKKSQKPKIRIPLKFILMPTSDDPRKNNYNAVKGFEKFNSSKNNAYRLIITSTINIGEQKRLKSVSNNIIFTGNIKDNELDWLYEKCDAVLFVPESEGLGLPILEAVLHVKPVVCSSIGVFREISVGAFYYCNHENVDSICSSIAKALKPIAEGEVVNKNAYRKISDHYSWRRVAKRYISATKVDRLDRSIILPRIAIFIPAPDGLSAIGKVVAESHPVISEYFDVEYFVESGHNTMPTRPNYLQYISKYSRADNFCVKDYMRYDAVFYHIGNSDYHIESIKNSLYLPGYVILHDTRVGEAYRIMSETGVISKARNLLEESITKKNLLKNSSYISSIALNQLGILTHSVYARESVKEIKKYKSTVMSVNLPTSCQDLNSYRSNSKINIGLAGIIAGIKGLEVIEQIAKNEIFNDCEINLFGYRGTSKKTLNSLSSYKNVSIDTNLTDYDFQESISKLDIFVNYRMQYQGETSLSTLEAMRKGVVVIVRNIGWYSELPDNVVVKVDSKEDVIRKLVELKSNKKMMKVISRNAIRYIRNSHSHNQYATGMMKLINSSKKENIALHGIVGEIKSGNVKTASKLLSLYNDYLEEN